MFRFQQRYISFELPVAQEWLNNGSKIVIDILGVSSNANFFSDYDFFNQLQAIIEQDLKKVNVGTEFELVRYDKFFIELIMKTINEGFEALNSKFELNSQLKKYSPITELRINLNVNIYPIGDKILIENLLIDFKVNGFWVPWSYLSDGTKRLFYIITETLSVDNGLVIIEEPELGIHPNQLYSLMQFIKDQSRFKQIIVSTHSPIVLDILEPDGLDRINIAKMTDGGTKFYKLTPEQIIKTKLYIAETGELSQYWLHSDLEDE